MKKKITETNLAETKSKLTPEDKAAIISMYKEKKSASDIAAKYKINKASIYSILKANDIPTNIIFTPRSSEGKPLKKSLRNKIISMKEKGRSIEEITTETGTTQAQVVEVLNSIKALSQAHDTGFSTTNIAKVLKEKKVSSNPIDNFLRKGAKLSKFAESVNQLTDPKKEEELDIRPSHEHNLGLILELYDGTPTQKERAIKELKRIAKIADRYYESNR